MAAAAPATAPQATITISDHSPNPNNDLYDVVFNYQTHITTTVTPDPSVVSSWITTLLSAPDTPRVVGLDVEWRPNFSRNADNPVATIQLCTQVRGAYTCLIFQVIHCPAPLPKKLVDFLANKDFTFVGAGVDTDVEKLLGDYGLFVADTADLGKLAKQRNVSEFAGKASVGLKELARVVLGVEVAKPKKVTMSRWDQGWLSYQQVQYACIDAFLSYEVGARLFGMSNAASSSHPFADIWD